MYSTTHAKLTASGSSLVMKMDEKDVNRIRQQINAEVGATVWHQCRDTYKFEEDGGDGGHCSKAR